VARSSSSSGVAGCGTTQKNTPRVCWSTLRRSSPRSRGDRRTPDDVTSPTCISSAVHLTSTVASSKKAVHVVAEHRGVPLIPLSDVLHGYGQSRTATMGPVACQVPLGNTPSQRLCDRDRGRLRLGRSRADTRCRRQHVAYGQPDLEASGPLWRWAGDHIMRNRMLRTCAIGGSWIVMSRESVDTAHYFGGFARR
jgi:hypothetical protein